MKTRSGGADEKSAPAFSTVPESVSLWVKRVGLVFGVLFLALFLWLVLRPKVPPFPLMAVAITGDEVEHVVQHRSIDVGGKVSVGQRSLWEGSLTVDEDWFDVPEESWSDDEIVEWYATHVPPDGDPERIGSLQPLVTETGIPLGFDARNADMAVALLDPDGDEVVDLMIIRQPGDEGPADRLQGTRATLEFSFLVSGTDEILVARPGIGTEILNRYVTGGVHGSVCDMFGVTAALPAADSSAPPEDEFVIWCQPPVEAAELVPLEGITVPGGGGLEEVDERDLDAAGDQVAPRSDADPGSETSASWSGEVATDVVLAAHRNRHDMVGPTLAAAQSGGSSRTEGCNELIEEAQREIDSLLEKIEAVKKLKPWVQGRNLNEGARNFVIGKAKDLTIRGNGTLADDYLADLQKAMVPAFDPYDVIIASFQFQLKAIRAVLEAFKTECPQDCSGNFWEARRCSERRDPLPGPSTQAKRDPHLGTIDGVSYNFQGVGEWTLARAEDLEVQVRFQPVGFNSNASVAGAVAARLTGSDRAVSVYANQQGRDDGWVVWLEDEAFLIPEGTTRLGDYLVTTDVEWDGGSGAGLAFMAGSDEILVVRQFSAVLTDTFSFSLYPGSSRLTGGLGGTNDDDGSNDFVLADGTDPFGGLPEHDDLYGTFSDSWRVKTVDESLFQYLPGEGPESFYDPAYPTGSGTIADLTEEDLEWAVTVCKANGAIAEPELSDCAYDVGVTRDEGWAEGYGWQWTGEASLALPNGQVRDVGTLTEFGSLTLWRAGGFEVVANIAVSDVAGVHVPVIRGLKVTRGTQTEIVWPGWRDVPETIELSDGATLNLHPSGLLGLTPELVGDAPGLDGLATESGEEELTLNPENPLSGIPTLRFEVVQTWSDPWLSPEGLQ